MSTAMNTDERTTHGTPTSTRKRERADAALTLVAIQEAQKSRFDALLRQNEKAPEERARFNKLFEVYLERVARSSGSQ